MVYLVVLFMSLLFLSLFAVFSGIFLHEKSSVFYKKREIALSGMVLSAVFVLFGLESVHAGSVSYSKSYTAASQLKTIFTARDPVAMHLGEYFFTMDMADAGGPMPMKFQLYYGSQLGGDKPEDGLPFFFTSSHAMEIATINFPPEIESFVYLGAGRQITFLYENGTWSSVFEPIPYQLQDTGEYFCFTDPARGLVYFFEKPLIPLEYGVDSDDQVVSSDVNGNVGWESNSTHPSISDDGRFVVFQTANSLVDDDKNEKEDIYLKDRYTGEITRISRALDGGDPDSRSLSPSISSDGRFVVYESYASNLVENDTNDSWDIFVYEIETGVTKRVSVASDGSQADGYSEDASISGDGRFVVFASSADNLADAPGVNWYKDIYLHDCQTGQTEIISVNAEGIRANDGCSSPVISADGRYIAYESYADNLVEGDTNDVADIFLYDRITGETKRISVASDGTEANDSSGDPAISGDGRYIAYMSNATNLVDQDTNGCFDVFLYDRITGTTQRVSVMPDGTEIDGCSDEPSLSYDGRYIAFSTSGDLGTDDFWDHIYVRDMVKGDVVLVSRGRAGQAGNSSSYDPDITGDGKFVAFDSYAENFIAGDANGMRDIYVAGKIEPDMFTSPITRIQDRNGNFVSFTYNDDRLPSRVEDNFGHSLEFGYTDIGGKNYLETVSDDTGNTWRFTYEDSPDDNKDNVTLRSVTDPGGGVYTFRYQGGNHIESVTKPRGNVPYTNTYDDGGFGIITSQTDAFGNKFQFQKTDTNTFRIIDPDGNTRTFANKEIEFGAFCISSFTDEKGNTILFSCSDMIQRIESITDRKGNRTSITYDQQSGMPASITLPGSQEITYEYEYLSQTQQFQDPSGVQFQCSFYPLSSIKRPDGSKEVFEYDEKGNLIRYTDGAGNTWEYEYDSHGYVSREKNPEGGQITYTYNSDGLLASMTDSDAGSETYTYDGKRRLSKVTRPDDSFITYTYDLLGRLTEVTDAAGVSTAYEYDSNGNLVKITKASNTSEARVTVIEYDDMDRISRITGPDGASLSFTYNFLDAITGVTFPGGATIAVEYDERGWISEVVDPAGNRWRISRDDEGAPVKVVTPEGREITLEVDPLGFFTRIMDPAGKSFQIVRDAMERISSITDRMGRTISYQYDGEGRLSGVSLPVIGTVAYQYDGLGNLAAIEDPQKSLWRFSHTSMGRLESFTDPLGNTKTYSYDSLGRISAIDYPGGITETRTYDAAGNLIERRFSDGTSIGYTYNAHGEIIQTSSEPVSLEYDVAGRVTKTTMDDTDITVTYDSAGRVQSMDYDGDMTVTYTYDARSLVTRVEDSLSGAWMRFEYDNDGFLTAIRRSNGVDTVFTLDAAGRVTSIDHGGKGGIDLTLNAEGEITRMVTSLGAELAAVSPGILEHLMYNSANRITSPGFSYDALGRRTADPDRTYTWDAAGRLTGITMGTESVTMAYTAGGEVARMTSESREKRFVYTYSLAGHPLVVEKDDSGLTRFYVYTPAGSLCYMVEKASAKPCFYHFNQIGSVMMLTDDTGTVTDTYGYSPYGQLLGHEGSTDQPFTFVGKFGVRMQGSTGLYQMRARYYDSKTARFISPDPRWPDITEPKAINPYSYAAANPLINIDPSGLFYIDARGRRISEKEMFDKFFEGELFGDVDERTGNIKWYKRSKKSGNQIWENLQSQSLYKNIRQFPGYQYSGLDFQTSANSSLHKWFSMAETGSRSSLSKPAVSNLDDYTYSRKRDKYIPITVNTGRPYIYSNGSSCRHCMITQPVGVSGLLNYYIITVFLFLSVWAIVRFWIRKKEKTDHVS